MLLLHLDLRRYLLRPSYFETLFTSCSPFLDSLSSGDGKVVEYLISCKVGMKIEVRLLCPAYFESNIGAVQLRRLKCGLIGKPLPVIPTHTAAIALQTCTTLAGQGRSTPIHTSTLHAKRLIISEFLPRDRLQVGFRVILDGGLAFQKEGLVLWLGVEKSLTKLIRHMIIEE